MTMPLPLPLPLPMRMTMTMTMTNLEVGECGINIYEFAEYLLIFCCSCFLTSLRKKGFSLGKENPEENKKKNEACIKLVRRFLRKKPKAKNEQGMETETTRIVTSRAALWHAFDGLTCGPRFPLLVYPIPSLFRPTTADPSANSSSTPNSNPLASRR